MAAGEFLLELQSVEIEVLVGACADEDLVAVLSIDLSVGCEIKSNFLVKSVDEKVKKLILVKFTVCLLGFEHTFCKQTFYLTSFVKY